MLQLAATSIYVPLYYGQLTTSLHEVACPVGVDKDTRLVQLVTIIRLVFGAVVRHNMWDIGDGYQLRTDSGRTLTSTVSGKS